MQHVQSAAHFAKCARKLRDTVPDKLDTPIPAIGELIQNIGIKNEHAVHLARLLERETERSVIGVAQIAPEPYQRSVIPPRHHVTPQASARRSRRTTTPISGNFA